MIGMDFDKIITAINSAPLFSSASTSSPSSQSSFGHLPSHEDESPPLVVRPCGACKGLRRRCVATCILAPYFPPTQPFKFLAVHKVFGASNVSKVLQGLPESDRADAVKSMVFEATTRIRDPVYGCAGLICCLQELVNQLQMELSSAKAQLLSITSQQENLPDETMTFMEMKEDQLPTLQQHALENYMFGNTSIFQSCESFSSDNSFLPFDVFTDSGGI